MVTRLASIGLALLCASVIGCGGKDRISLTADVQSVDLTVQEGPFGTFLSGTVALRLHLGPDAPGSTDVELESLKLQRASDDLELVPTLSLTEPLATVSLDPGDEQVPVLELDATEPLTAATTDDLCAEPVEVRGSVTDSLNDGRSTPFSSRAVTPAGCP